MIHYCKCKCTEYFEIEDNGFYKCKKCGLEYVYIDGFLDYAKNEINEKYLCKKKD